MSLDAPAAGALGALDGLHLPFVDVQSLQDVKPYRLTAKGGGSFGSATSAWSRCCRLPLLVE